MIREQLLTWTAGILTTLNEVSPTDPIPASTIYLAMGMDMSDYEIVTRCMQSCGYIRNNGNNTIGLTELGRTKAIEIENAIAKRQ